MKKLLIFSLLIFLILGCQGQQKTLIRYEDDNELISLRALKANMEFLASDELQGREAGTNSEQVASGFIASEFKKYGVEPFFEDNQYFQTITLRKIHFADTSNTQLIDTLGQSVKDFKYGIHFTGSTRYYEPVDTTTNLVFVGYGITAEEYDYDDYAGLDVRNKIVLIYYGEPESDDTTFFEGKNRSLHASIFKKIDNARSKGALGVIHVSAWEKQFGWESVVGYVSKGKFKLNGEDIKSDFRSFPTTVLSEDALADLMAHGSYSYQDLQIDISNLKSPTRFQFDSKLKVYWAFDTTETVEARNVVGMVRGTDPQLKNEYVSIGAHFDHEGVGPAGVYNGADDNASGTVAVLELARVFAENRPNKRSVLFMLHTAEEKGLLGSKYLSENMNNLDNMIAHVNLDMIGREATDSIYSIGSDRLSSEFSDLIDQVNSSGMNLFLDKSLDQPDDKRRLYYRSDQYNFAKKGIPVVFFFDNHKEDYHRITDDIEKINYQKIKNVTQLVYDITVTTANRRTKFGLESRD